MSIPTMCFINYSLKYTLPNIRVYGEAKLSLSQSLLLVSQPMTGL